MNSLPQLSLESREGKSPFTSFESFLSLAQEALAERDALQLEIRHAQMSDPLDKRLPHDDFLSYYWELKADLQQKREAQKAQFLQVSELKIERSAEPDAQAQSNQIMGQTVPLSREKAFMLALWRKTEQISIGHYYDLSALTLYGYQLALQLTQQSWKEETGKERFNSNYELLKEEISKHFNRETV